MKILNWTKMLPTRSINLSSPQTVRQFWRQINKTAVVPISNRNLKNDENGLVWNFRESKLLKQSNVRDLSTAQAKIKSIATPLVFPEEDRRTFMSVFPEIVQDLTENTHYAKFPEVSKRFARLLYYNVPQGKKFRGNSTLSSYKMLEKPDKLTPENVRLACRLGWCIEVLQAYLLIVDDILDQATIRRGQPAWFTIKDVGLMAANDGVLLENSVFHILKKYFSSHSCYVQMLEIFHEVGLNTCIGQMMDTMIMRNGRPDLNAFTMDMYSSIVKYKTGYYAFILPVALPMYLAGIDDPELHRKAGAIQFQIGEFYQAQDDFIDCFNDFSATGKIGTDIDNGKCTWLAIEALQRCSPEQKQVMEEHYGKPEPDSVQRIKKLYEELDLPAVYAKYNEKTLRGINDQIQQVSKELPPNMFYKFLEMCQRVQYSK